MKAMLVDEKQNLVWTEVEDPTLDADAVLVRVHAVGVNRADLLQRQGKYPSPPDCPPWMGLEVAGTVERVERASSIGKSEIVFARCSVAEAMPNT